MKSKTYFQPAKEVLRPGHVRCKRCNALIMFKSTISFDEDEYRYIENKKKMPVNAGLITGDGTKTLVVEYPTAFRGRVMPNASSQFKGYEPHFQACNKNRKFRI